MQVQWFSHLKSAKDQAQFKELLLGSKKVLDRLREICYNKSMSLSKNSETDFDNPNWSHKEAYRKGQLSILSEIEKLVTVSDNETN